MRRSWIYATCYKRVSPPAIVKLKECWLLNILQRPLPYALRLDHRSAETISLAVIHCTELPDLAMARVWGEKQIYPEHRTGNSGHIYIDRDGSIEQWVPFDRIAHHVRGYNHQSIGIELINQGRYPDWFDSRHQQMSEAYPDAQIEALAALLNYCAGLHPGISKISGHEDLDQEILPAENDPGITIRRKLDPGPLFPWSKLLQKISLTKSDAKKL
jgi:N-acetylmuramoyl-L-alanine amidase